MWLLNCKDLGCEKKIVFYKRTHIWVLHLPWSIEQWYQRDASLWVCHQYVVAVCGQTWRQLLHLLPFRTGFRPWSHTKSNSEYFVRNRVQAALQSNIRLKAKHFFLIDNCSRQRPSLWLEMLLTERVRSRLDIVPSIPKPLFASSKVSSLSI